MTSRQWISTRSVALFFYLKGELFMLSFEAFMDLIREKLQSYYGDECTVEYNTVTKNNGQVWHGISIRRKDTSCAPNIYMDDAYEEYKEGKSIEKITTELICLRDKCKDEVEFNADLFGDYEWVRERLGIKLVSRFKNSRLLPEVPHKDFSDMAVLFNVTIDDDTIGKGTILIHNEHMQMWNVSVDRLFEDAIASMMRSDPPYMADMVDVLIEMFESKEGACFGDYAECLRQLKEQLKYAGENGCYMYVLTNQSKINGASVIVYPGMLADISKKIGGDYYLLPSSIHEVIIVPVDRDEARGMELSMLVRDINKEKLSPDETLTDHAYRYHRATNWLEPVYENAVRECAS